jgi:hypothetical protein
MNLRRFVGRKAKDAELAEEIQSHLAHDEDLRTARGVDAEEARRQARVKFGPQNTVREQEWRYRSLPWVEAVGRDLKFVARSLAKTPGFTIVAIVVIAVGIGVNTAVFSVINTVLLKPLTFPHPEELVMLMNTSPQGTGAGRECADVQDLARADEHFLEGGGVRLRRRGTEPDGRRSPTAGAGRARVRGLLFDDGRAGGDGAHVHTGGG